MAAPLHNNIATSNYMQCSQFTEVGPFWIPVSCISSYVEFYTILFSVQTHHDNNFDDFIPKIGNILVMSGYYFYCKNSSVKPTADYCYYRRRIGGIYVV